jgi:hypothetical protein
MKYGILVSLGVLVLATTLQIRLSHDTKRGYSYQIAGPEMEEVIEADQKIRTYIRSQAPKKPASPAPSPAAPKPAPARK